jgi:hypothetical protein
MLFKVSNNFVQIYRSFSITGNYGRRSFSKYGKHSNRNYSAILAKCGLSVYYNFNVLSNVEDFIALTPLMIRAGIHDGGLWIQYTVYVERIPKYGLT